MVQNALPNHQPPRADKAAPDKQEELPESKVTGSSMSIRAARGVLHGAQITTRHTPPAKPPPGPPSE